MMNAKSAGLAALLTVTVRGGGARVVAQGHPPLVLAKNDRAVVAPQAAAGDDARRAGVGAGGNGQTDGDGEEDRARGEAGRRPDDDERRAGLRSTRT